MPKKEEATPNTPSVAHMIMTSRWSLINTVLAGTEAIRAAGETFLPKHVAEENIRYQERLSGSVLRNMTEETLSALAGKPFSEPIKRGDDIPEDVEVLLDNVDAEGNNLDSFCQEWFRSGIANGFSHVLVEFPHIVPKKDGTERTLEDDRVEGVRPYLVRIEPENLIFARTEIIGGEEVITHARIRRIVKEQAGEWGEIGILEIMVLEPNMVRIFRQKEAGKDDSEWVQFDAWVTGLNFVPLVTFYTDKQDTLLAKPPLLDLAYVNVAHWQSASDQRVSLSAARFPLLAVSGAAPEEQIVIAPFNFLSTESGEGRFYYVENQGHALKAGSDDLEAMEDWMAAHGAEFLRKKPGNQTATARALDSAESISKLQAWTFNFEDRISVVLGYMRAWNTKGRDFDGGTVSLVTDFGFSKLESASLDMLNKLRDRKDISRNALIEEMKRRDIIADSYDADEDLELILQEMMALIGIGGSDENLDVTAEDKAEEDDDNGKAPPTDDDDEEDN